jgi:purine-nucleoside phosphorylase
MLELYGHIQEATAAIRRTWQGKPHAGIILGTGLGGLAEEIDVEAEFDYEEIQHFPR